jgi:hypothetical protein
VLQSGDGELWGAAEEEAQCVGPVGAYFEFPSPSLSDGLDFITVSAPWTRVDLGV